MKTYDKCYNLVRQSGTKGIKAVEIARKLNMDKSTVHRHLSSLELREKVESTHGIWFAKTKEQTIKPLEKEIEIVFPLPKKHAQIVTLLELQVKQCEDINVSEDADFYRTFLEKYKEMRTIRIKGKNVDDLDLEKIGNMIKEA
ncbi:MAG: helix-turn-helix domain-containing protein, partial [Candidatus Ranarchaeia archaeon]